MENKFYDIAFRDSLTYYRYDLRCSGQNREDEKCLEEFEEQGFFKDFEWDRYAEYQYKCKDCPHFKHHVGFYFGDDKYTNDFSSKEIFVVGVGDTEELNRVVENMPVCAKALWIGGRKSMNYSALERLTGLESVCIGLNSGDVLWDMTKTPSLEVLEIQVGMNPPDITRIGESASLRHLGLLTLTSQVGNTVFPSLSFLKTMPSLDSLVLSNVASAEGSIDDLIEIPSLKRLWVSPHLFSTEDYAKFEALRFKIFDEYGIFKSEREESAIEDMRPLGRGKRWFKNEQSKEKFSRLYKSMMDSFREG